MDTKNIDVAGNTVETDLQKIKENSVLQQILSLKLTRNAKCPCGSGFKVKKCHKEYLLVRNKLIQENFDVDNGLARHNAKTGRKMTKQQYLEYLTLLAEQNKGIK